MSRKSKIACISYQENLCIEYLLNLLSRWMTLYVIIKNFQGKWLLKIYFSYRQQGTSYVMMLKKAANIINENIIETNN